MRQTNPVPRGHARRSTLLSAWLGLLIVLAIIATGYSATKISGQQSRISSLANELDAAASASEQAQLELEALKSRAPFFYALNDWAKGGSELHVITESGEDEVLFANASGYIELFAVPQTRYDGRIFVTRLAGDTDNPSLPLEVLDVASGASEPVAFVDELPYRDAVAASPDGTMLAAAYDSPADNLAAERELVVWNLLTGERRSLVTLPEGEHFAGSIGGSTFAGATDFSIRWLGLSCVQARIHNAIGIVKEYRTFCFE